MSVLKNYALLWVFLALFLPSLWIGVRDYRFEQRFTQACDKVEGEVFDTRSPYYPNHLACIRKGARIPIKVEP